MRVSTVRAVNRLTARWAEALPPGPDTVLSATGVWPLLAFLADGAAGPARGELEEALGMPAGEAAEAARELLALLARIPGVGSAVGLWTRPRVALRQEWAAGLPDATLGRLGADDAANQKALDTWAAERTGGLIPAMPIAVEQDTELVLATALAARTTWLRPFQEGGMWPEYGPWAGRDLVALRRTTSLLDRVGVAETDAGPLTVLRVLGDTGVDVHLLLGPEEAERGAVLRAGLDVLAGAPRAVPGDLLPLGEPGPGLNIRHVRSTSPWPRISVTTSPFSLDATHDLTGLHEVFGLTTALDAGRGHFPDIADHPPLAVREARQAAMARFDAKGFEAAAVTAIGLIGGAALAPRTPYAIRSVDLDFDRPFGFLTVHRTSRLVLTAGWVHEPVPFVFEEEEAEEED